VIIERESGSLDDITFSISIYIVGDHTLKMVKELIFSNKLEYDFFEVNSSEIKHNYAVDINLEQNFEATQLANDLIHVMRQEFHNCKFAIHVNLTSEYDHAGVELAANSNALIMQHLLNCTFNFHFISI